MIPVGLLAVWIVMNTSFFVNDVLSVANRFGLLTSVSDWMRFGTSSPANWSSTLGQIGVLRGNSLDPGDIHRNLYKDISAADHFASFDRTALSELDRDLVDASSTSATRPTPRRLTSTGWKEQNRTFVNKENRMIDPIKILQRAWHILWNYRTLWVFGLILALAAGGSFNGGNNGMQWREENQSYEWPSFGSLQEALDYFNRELNRLFTQGIPEANITGPGTHRLSLDHRRFRRLHAAGGHCRDDCILCFRKPRSSAWWMNMKTQAPR